MHSTHVDGLTPEELAKIVGNLRYDALADFLSLLSDDLQEQSVADYENDRRKLAMTLRQVRAQLKIAVSFMRDAWDISKPHMKEEPKPPVISDTEAESMLKRLATHFKQPVMPIQKYCKGIEDWFDAIIDSNESDAPKKYGQQGESYYRHLGHIRTDMHKSNLLWRRLYMDQPMRTQKCPLHEGHWDGQTQLFYGCSFGCGGCGWLPNTPEEIEKTAWIYAGVRWKGPTILPGVYNMRFKGDTFTYFLEFGKPSASIGPVTNITHSGIRFHGEGPKERLIPGAHFEVLAPDGALIGLGAIQMGDPPDFTPLV